MWHICGICGLQCYDLDRICAVLKVKKKKEQIASQWSRVLEKLTFNHLVKIPSFNGK